MDFTFGITLHLERKKKPFAIGKVFYNKGEHLIEFTDPDNVNHMIKGLIPPYPETAQTPAEDKKGSHGIG